MRLRDAPAPPFDARTLAVLVVALAVGPTLALAGGTAGAALSSTDSTAADELAAQAPTPITGCTVIDEPGRYVLTADVENGGDTRISETCIEITADDVTLDGDGYTLDGRGVSHTTGVGVAGADNATVRNLAVNDWHAGVEVTNGSATVQDVRTFSNAYGVRLENGSGSTVENNTVEDNLVGVYADAPNVTLADNRLSGNEIGVTRENASDGTTAAEESPALGHLLVLRP